MYNGIATLPDGSTVSVSGTFAELAEWADNFIRNTGECSISITMDSDQKQNERSEFLHERT